MYRTGRGAGVIAAVAIGALALTGCSGGSGEEPERIWVGVVGGDPMNFGLNAQLATGNVPRLFSAQILDPLVFLSDGYELSPALAESWEVSDDGLAVTFDLRDGVTWHDGEPFTAEDVKFNFEEIVPLSVYGAELDERLASVEILDEDTVELRLAEPFGPLMETIASQYMLPQHVYEGTDYLTNEANNAPIGTGPMMYDSYSPGESVTLAKNPDFWGGEVQVDRAIFTVIADATTRAEALFAGEVDEATLHPSQQARVQQSDELMLLERGQYPEYVNVAFNTETPVLQDAAVRAAIYATLDREALAETALSGIGTPATGFFPEEVAWAASPDVDFDADFPHDIDAINAALDAAGFPRGADGTRFTLRVVYITALHEVVSTVEMAQSMLAEVGIAVEHQSVGGAAYVEQVYQNGDFDLAFSRGPLGPDPSLGIANWYQCNEPRLSGRNPSGLCDPEIDAAAATAISTLDQDARAEAFRTMQERARDLMFYAPIAWYNGAFPTVNTSRWDGMDSPRIHAERRPWLDMTPAG